MKIRLMSDIHFEVHKDGGKAFLASITDPTGDVLVLAGDIGSPFYKHHGVPTLELGLRGLAEKFPHIVYVMGNHEHYWAPFHFGKSAVRDICNQIPNVHFLDSQTVTIDGQRFVGTTMWYSDCPQAACIENSWSDFGAIAHLRPMGYASAEKEQKFLLETVQSTDVVVTHFLPSPQCEDPRFKGAPTNVFFVQDKAEQVILHNTPKLWCHGHTHSAVDVTLGSTRVVCNPFGYAFEGHKHFSDLVVEV